jgi:hypothetical protein
MREGFFPAKETSASLHAAGLDPVERFVSEACVRMAISAWPASVGRQTLI